MVMNVEHYVTLFDELYVPQGLALHMSMERHVRNYLLWIICVDDTTYEILNKLNLLNVRLVQLSRVETAELLSVKSSRTKGEYCWTLTPFSVRFVFDAEESIKRVTYIDADMWFRKSPDPIFNEFNMSGKDVLITDHAYAPEYDQSATSGKFCVQFMIFNREGGEVVRKKWEELCLEWCFNRYEENRFGDQKYLDSWPDEYSDYVHILHNQELLLAPWNATRFPYSSAITWHFHGMRIIKTKKRFQVFYGNFPLPNPAINYVYQPYTTDLITSINALLKMQVDVKSQVRIKKSTIAFSKIINIIKNIFRYKSNILDDLIIK